MIKHKSHLFSSYNIAVCILLFLSTIISAYYLDKYTQTDPTWVKITLSCLTAGSLGLLVNKLTNMFNADTKRRELAEEVYNNLYPIAENLLIKSQQEPLSLKEYEILSNLTKTMGNLGKYCNVDLNQIHNVYQRLKQNPPIYDGFSTGSYGALQTYNTFLINHNHAPTVADSGSLAIPPTRQKTTN